MATSPSSLPAGASGRVPENKGGSLLLWLLGILGAGVAILCVVTFAIVTFFMHGSRFEKQGRHVSITTPLGGLELKQGANPGLPKYPGATDEKQSGSFALTGMDDEKLEIIAAHYSTSDPLAQVDSWYGKTLGSAFERKGPGENKTIREYPHTEIHSSETAYVSDHNDIVRLVVLNPKASGVEIKLVRIGPRDVQ